MYNPLDRDGCVFCGAEVLLCPLDGWDVCQKCYESETGHSERLWELCGDCNTVRLATDMETVERAFGAEKACRECADAEHAAAERADGAYDGAIFAVEEWK